MKGLSVSEGSLINLGLSIGKKKLESYLKITETGIQFPVSRNKFVFFQLFSDENNGNWVEAFQMQWKQNSPVFSRFFLQGYDVDDQAEHEVDARTFAFFQELARSDWNRFFLKMYIENAMPNESQIPEDQISYRRKALFHASLGEK